MAEEPKVESKVEEPKVEPKEDLVTKVSKVEIKETPKEEATFNVNDIDKIEDPQAKEYAQKAYKSLQGDYTRKYQALADERKTWEAKKTESGEWTREKVQTLLDDPKFVSAAQNVVTQQQTEEFSALSDGEKKQLKQIQTAVQQMTAQNAQLLKQQQDEANKTKYANYDAGAVDIITAELISGKMQATREHLWKVHDYDPAVRRAYELGKQDRKLENQEKATSISAEGTTAVGDEEIPKMEKGESDKNYFLRLAARRLAKKAESGQVRK